MTISTANFLYTEPFSIWKLSSFDVNIERNMMIFKLQKHFNWPMITSALNQFNVQCTAYARATLWRSLLRWKIISQIFDFCIVIFCWHFLSLYQTDVQQKWLHEKKSEGSGEKELLIGAPRANYWFWFVIICYLKRCICCKRA